VRIFSLTPLTVGASRQRRIVLHGFDLPARGIVIGALALLPALLLTAFAWTFVGELALFMIPLTELVAFWLVEYRVRSGLRLRMYQALNDRRKAKNEVGKFFVAGFEFDPDGEEWYIVKPGSVPAKPLFQNG